MNELINNLTFEKLNINDIETIKKLEDEQNISILSINTIKNEINSDTSKYYVVKFNDLIVAYTNISIILDTVEINSLVVKKDFQRKGIAIFTLKNIFNICNKKNVQKILLEVRISNLPAQKLYEKIGFNKISIRKKYYPDNLEDALIYEYIFKKSD